MINQFVKATTYFNCKPTVNIDFLLAEISSALPLGSIFYHVGERNLDDITEMQ